ncbi:kelch-like protein [Cotia virus SPAn232]|uniref:Kelch-like protein n=2 Tax=Cotia virus TaxID=39444 RepID=H6TAH1_9POXV|nr:kelch-like protein [Cotia virus SPAn232]AFB76908.1 kelch-like protein [Cotia virus SPAn232]AIT70633.1 kelch-like protein [Cotia virus]
MFTTRFVNMVKFYRTSTLCDVNILLNNCVIKAHKLLLSVSSQYLHTLIDKYLINDTINLSHLDSNAVKIILKFIYSINNQDKIIDFNNIDSVLEAADFLQVDDVLIFCKIYIKDNIYKNLNKAYELMSKYYVNDDMLYNTIIKYIKNNFKNIIINKSFKDYNIYLFDEFLKSDNYSICYSDDDIFEDIVYWIMYNKTNRIKYAKDLFNNVNIDLVSNNNIEIASKKLDLSINELEFNNNIIRLKKNMYFCYKDENHNNIFYRTTKYGYEKIKMPTENIFYEDIYGDVEILDKEISIKSITSSDENIFMYNKDANEILKYDIDNKSYSIIDVDLVCLSDNPAMIVYKNYLYIIYPHEKGTITRIIDINNYSNKSHLKIINKELYDIKTVIVENNIYFIGLNKSNNKNHLYKLVKNKWIECTKPNVTRENGTVSSVDGKIYYMGGMNLDLNWTCVSECYDTKTDTWSFLESLPFKIVNSVSYVVKDTIVIICGMFLHKVFLDNIFNVHKIITYNTKTKKYKTYDDNDKIYKNFPYLIYRIIYINNKSFTILN